MAAWWKFTLSTCFLVLLAFFNDCVMNTDFQNVDVYRTVLSIENYAQCITFRGGMG